jgi:hypothetical protein
MPDTPHQAEAPGRRDTAPDRAAAGTPAAPDGPGTLEIPPMPAAPPPVPPAGGGLPALLRQGPAVWLSAGAFALALIALIVAVTSGGSDTQMPKAGATGPVGPAPTASRAAQPTESAESADSEPATEAPASPAATDTTTGAVQCPEPTVTVRDASGLEQALASAQPGTVIRLEDGRYEGKFVAKTPGTQQQPVFLCGGSGAVLDGGGIKKGYALHLDGASWWRVVGLTVTNSQKGVVADKVQHALIQGLTVDQIGDEAIHLRDFSSDNVVQGNTVSNTGLRRDKFGEGIYIGSAVSNWPTNSGGKPDNSDRNIIRGNTITATTAEAIDIKEGTTGGIVAGNTFDGSKQSGSHNDSWIDVKGNGWVIEGNTGNHSLKDGFQVHEVVKGWGRHNVFRNNRANVDGPGYGFWIQSPEDNDVACSNKASAAAEGLTNGKCS